MDHKTHILACQEAQEYIEKKIKTTAPTLKEAAARLFEENNARVVSRQWSVGGKTMDRGYYCPSTLRDLVVVGQLRGRLLKRPRSQSAPSFCYGFDQDNRLITVVTLEEQSGRAIRKEALFYEGMVQYGIAADEDGGRITLCVCRYEGESLLSYRLFFYNEDVGVDRFFAEDYERKKDGQAEVTFYEFRRQGAWSGELPVPRLYDHRTYNCITENGILLECSQTDYDRDGEKLPSFNVPVFKRGGRRVKI